MSNHKIHNSIRGGRNSGVFGTHVLFDDIRKLLTCCRWGTRLRLLFPTVKHLIINIWSDRIRNMVKVEGRFLFLAVKIIRVLWSVMNNMITGHIPLYFNTCALAQSGSDLSEPDCLICLALIAHPSCTSVSDLECTIFNLPSLPVKLVCLCGVKAEGSLRNPERYE